MENISIENILESGVGLKVIENADGTKTNEIIDNRYDLLMKKIESIENKDNIFYEELINLMSKAINKFYNIEICQISDVVFDNTGSLVEQTYINLHFEQSYLMKKACKEFAKKLFDYICTILENHKDIKISKQTLTELLNSDPKKVEFSIEDRYIGRLLDFKRLAEIINKNNNTKDFDVEEITTILIDSCQIHNEDVFKNFITKEQYLKGHNKLDEFLMHCNAKTFLEVTKIIIAHYDKDFDRFAFIKKRQKNNFYEYFILEMLDWNLFNTDVNLIHELLTSTDYNINYNVSYDDYFGHTNLRNEIALSGNKVLIEDLLSKKENIQSYYSHGDSGTFLYNLYAIIGKYDKAIETFEKDYDYKSNGFIEDFDDDLNKTGIAYGEITYKDSIVEFIRDICNSVNDNNAPYINIKEVLFKVLNSPKIDFVNLEEIVYIIKKVLTPIEQEELITNLIKKYNSGTLKFIEVEETEESNGYYTIKVVSPNELEDYLNLINKNNLTLKK